MFLHLICPNITNVKLSQSQILKGCHVNSTSGCWNYSALYQNDIKMWIWRFVKIIRGWSPCQNLNHSLSILSIVILQSILNSCLLSLFFSFLSVFSFSWFVFTLSFFLICIFNSFLFKKFMCQKQMTSGIFTNWIYPRNEYSD